MARRTYVETADSYAPLKMVRYLQGLGEAPSADWPRGRTYWDTAHFRSPYDKGGLQYFQDGSLLGLGAPPSGLEARVAANAPPAIKRFLLSGEPVPTWRTNLGLAFNQVSPWVYGAIAAGALGLSYFKYKQFKKKGRAAGG